MHLIGISIIVQLLCAVHCVRNGRNSMWLMVILFLSIPGCLAYAFFEIVPQYAGRREVRTVKAAALRKLDPERQLRAARDALDLADTAANRTALGDALADSGASAEAVEQYRAARAMAPPGDRGAQLKLARALLEAGEAAEARSLLETLPENAAPSETDRTRLLLARALEEVGERERALEIYADLSERLPGAEAHCRRAALLIARGRSNEAVPVLEDVERLAKRLDRFERAEHAEMYAWAQRTLGELRAAQPGV